MVLERDARKFAAVQVLIHDRKREFIESSPLDDYSPGTEERLQQVIDIFAISAESYLELVVDLDSQKAYTTVLITLGRETWAAYANIESQFLMGPWPREIEASINHWINEGYRQLASRGDGAAKESAAEVTAEFPNRASWLSLRLRERAWDHNDPWRHSGPDRKTVDKILAGQRVREDVLEKLCIALSAKNGKVQLLDIPND